MENSIKLYRKILNGNIYYIDFGETIHPEINNIHLGILFNVECCQNMILCLPLTSPKPKHFKTLKDFYERNYHNLKYFNLYYIKDTDSILLMDQFRMISKSRIKSHFKKTKLFYSSNLSSIEISKIKTAFYKFLNIIIN